MINFVPVWHQGVEKSEEAWCHIFENFTFRVMDHAESFLFSLIKL
jgi:hypothetical protein